MFKTLLGFIVVLGTQAASAGIMEDFDSLGGNNELMGRAKDLAPEKEIRVVQNRVVDKRWRSEFSAGYSNVLGGDAFNDTQMYNLSYHLHITPRWAVGLNWFKAGNQLSREGRAVIESGAGVPQIDAPDTGYEIAVNYAPIYGKLNMFGLGVAQFDVYGIGTYGQIQLASGSTDTFGLGAGLGVWISQHLTTRFEVRQRFYEAQRFGGGDRLQTTVAGLSFGYML